MKIKDILTNIYELMVREYEVPNSIIVNSNVKARLNKDYLLNCRIYHSSLFNEDSFLIGKFSFYDNYANEKGRLDDNLANHIKDSLK